MGLLSSLINKFTYRGNSYFFGDSSYSNERKEDDVIVKEGYINNAHVYSIVSMIAKKGGVIPIDVFRNGEFSEDENISIITNKSKEDFIEQAIYSDRLTGDLYFLVIETTQLDSNFQTKKGFVYEQLNPTGIQINISANGEVQDYRYNNGYTTATYQPEEILHIKCFDPSYYGMVQHTGLSPLQAAYMTLTASNNGQIANANMLKNGGVKGIISSASNGDAGLGAMKFNENELQDIVNTKLGRSEKFNSVYATKASVTYTPIGLSATDLKILEMNVVDLRTLCNVYGVPSQIFNDASNKTYNNQKQGEISLLENGVLPVLNKILRDISRDLQSRGEDIELKADTSGLTALQEDKLREATKNEKVTTNLINILTAVQAGSMTPEQAKATLINVWGMDEEKVNELIP